MSCPPWCKAPDDSSNHYAAVARGKDVTGGSAGVAIHQSEVLGPQVQLHFLDLEPLGTTVVLEPRYAAALGAVMPALGGPRWLGEALIEAARILGHESAAESPATATEATTPATR